VDTAALEKLGVRSCDLFAKSHREIDVTLRQKPTLGKL